MQIHYKHAIRCSAFLIYNLLSFSVAAQLIGPAQEIESDIPGAENVRIADMDMDNDLDVIATFSLDDKLIWYENDGALNFSPHVVTDSMLSALAVVPADLDGDNDTDLVATGFDDDKIHWFEQTAPGQWQDHIIASPTYPKDVEVVDVNEDGHLDIVASMGSELVLWYENDGSQSFSPHVITDQIDNPQMIAVADLDEDDDIDVISTSYTDDRVAWYENDGNESFTMHTITTLADGAQEPVVADIDGDNDLDIVVASSSDDNISWYENDGNEGFSYHLINGYASSAQSVFVTDMEGDGDMDVLSASSGNDTFSWSENDGDENFTNHTISNDAESASSIVAGDLDEDGDPDVLGAFTGGPFDPAQVVWFENFSETLTSAASFESRVIKIYPNPSNGLITVRGNQIEGVNTARVYNNVGSVVKTISLTGKHKSRIDLACLDTGVYYLCLESDKGAVLASESFQLVD